SPSFAGPNAQSAAPAFTKPPSAQGAPALTIGAPNAVPRIGDAPPMLTKKDPEVRTHKEQFIYCEPEDSSFAAVSMRVYNTAKYAKALHKYNWVHPLVSDNIRQENPRLQPKQILYVPPREFLEERYAADI